jgi:hypothetical protein
VFLGTIKGKNQLYRTYEAAKGDPAWFTLWQDVDVDAGDRRRRDHHRHPARDAGRPRADRRRG